MILADKIIYLRKKCAWSQEELAEKMNVSRQSISKWESGQSVPDLDKILKLCKVFGVSTDYLLKEEIEESEVKEDVYEPVNVKHVSAEEAHEFMEQKKKSAVRIGIGVVLCVLSPVVLFFMLGISSMAHIKETLAVAIGLGALMLMVIVAVYLFIRWGNECGSYLQLLQRGDYAPKMKKNMAKHELIGGIYWCTVTAIYLGISFLTNRWDITWIIWPVVALIYGGIACIIDYSEKKKAD